MTDQKEAPLLDAIEAFHRENRLSFTIPGHKQGAGADADLRRVLGEEAFAADICVIGGLDDRRATKGIESSAGKLAASAWDAEEAQLSTNGSSLSVQAALMSVAGPRDRLLVARNMHMSGVNGLVLSGIEPIFVAPEMDEDLEIAHTVTPEAAEAAFAANPDARGLIVVSPTYYGVTADVARLADVCHRHDVPLIVDQAWGPHFAFHPELPEHASTAGADLVVMSVHKTLGAFAEASIILRRRSLVDAERLTLAVTLLESTSASSIILGSLDGARREMVRDGRRRLGETLRLVRAARQRLAKIDGIEVMGREVVGRPGAFDLDETKLVFDVRGLGITGFTASDWLYEECGIAIELADHRRLMAVVTIGDTEASIGRLVGGMRELATWAADHRQPEAERSIPPVRKLLTESVMRPRDAFFGPVRRIPLAEAKGEIAAETVAPYPPGIPVLSPGDRITPTLVAYLEGGVRQGMYVEAGDSSMQTIRVVDGSSKRTKRR
ncbi:MAG TPA: aminotransferase class I/II-fold pyridoxal phosphate-dependent enzyme [Candidatus Limnocylindrales bacterium]